MPSGEAAAVIGKSVQIRGEVRGSEDLQVEGQVDGTIALTESRLTVGAHARVQANLSARDVIVLGHVTGEIRATGRVELRAGSTVSGDIHAGRLSIEENAVYCGKVELTSSAGANAAASAGGERAATASHATATPATPTVALGAH
ncbi:MAG TPA: polymer-forming cytoskeletal protein [Acidobacteriaceae bacterium]|nr:polymer-forming cytoskeletal protein [Acidobacteriaceae bacterium]